MNLTCADLDFSRTYSAKKPSAKGSQEELSRRAGGMGSNNISLLEHNRLDIGKKRAEALATAFNVHPAIIMFPEHEHALSLKPLNFVVTEWLPGHS